MNALGIIILLLIFSLTSLAILEIVDYYKTRPCLEYKDVCQKQKIYSSYYVQLKMSMANIDYIDVPCSESHNRVIKKCIKR